MACSLKAQVLVNEVCSSNTNLIADDDGDYEDWIELYNAGISEVDLDGFFISDDASDPFQYTLPPMVLAPGDFVLIWASGKDKVSSGGEVHSNFKLSSAGEPVLLSNAEGERIDSVPAVQLATNMSYGRQADGQDTWYYFLEPTPGASNNDSEGASEYLAEPQILTPSGFYFNPFTLFILHDDDEVELRYTTDGSVPDESSELYLPAEGIAIENRLNEPENISAIPTTPSTVPAWYRWFPPIGSVYKGTSIRIRAFKSGAIPSPPATGTFIVDPDVEERYDLQRVAISLPPGDLLGPSGVYTNFLSSGPLWEREAHFELFDESGVSYFQSHIGLRLHGGNSRRYALKSFRLYFRNRLGADALEHPIFDAGSMHRHERLLLRNSGSEWSRTYFRDAFAQSIIADYSKVDYMRYRPMVTFVNGEYWGILNLRERFDDNYVKNHYGYERDEIDMLEMISTPVYGSNAEYLALRSFWQSADLAVESNYQHVLDRIHVDNFRDYHIHQIFCMNTDQPGKNVRFWKPKEEGGKWRWMLFDLDDTFALGPHCDYERNGLVFCSGLDSISDPIPNPITPPPAWAPNGPNQTLPLRAMLRSPFFQHDFINRFADLLNTAYQPQRLTALAEQFDEGISDYMQEHFLRWHRPEPEFRQEHLDLVEEFSTNRKGVMESHIIHFFELAGSYTLDLDVQPPNGGHIKVNSIYLHPDSVYMGEGDPYPWQGLYYQGLDLPISAHARPGYVFSHWLQNGVETDSIVISPQEDLALTAVFEQVSTHEPIHYWSFNGSDAQWHEPYFSIGGAGITLEASGSTFVELDDGAGFEGENNRLGQETGTHLRVHYPQMAELLLQMPTTGYKEPILSYECRRSGQGASRHQVYITTDGEAYMLVDSLEIYDDDPLLYTLDLSAFLHTADNADFGVKIRISQGEGGEAGNNRIDNVVLDALPFDGQHPPGLELPIFRQEVIADGSTLQIDLDTYFSHPEGEPLSYILEEVEDPELAEVLVQGNHLVIQGQEPGLTQAWVLADDGIAEPVATAVELMVYPEAATIGSDQGYLLSEWDENAAEGSFPEHMIFLQSEVVDPGLHSPLPYPYSIPEDEVHPDDIENLGFPYSYTRRSRINGLGEEGFSFINTGRSRDLGAALLAIDLSQMEEQAYLSFVAGTVQPNSRVYRWRLQYRVGIEDAFEDLLLDGDAVEYEREELPDSEMDYSLIPLPEFLHGEPYVQLLWRYYFSGQQVFDDFGARSMLRLDNIIVGSADFDHTANESGELRLLLYPNPATEQLHIEHELGAGSIMRMYSIQGALIGEHALQPGRDLLSIADLAPGMYTLKFSNMDGLLLSQKLMITQP